MSSKRMRVFAGPNGSGKTTIIKTLKERIRFGVYVNADDIESSLNNINQLNFKNFKLKIDQNEIQNYFKKSQFSPVKRNEENLWSKLEIKNNILSVNTFIDSYLAADLSDFIRQQLLLNNLSFTYETVMSHESKIDFLQLAKEKGYKVYLYYVATEDPLINIRRVELRVTQNGHAVNPLVTENRYYKSLKNLKKAVKNTDRTYIWDNSGDFIRFLSEITNGYDVKIMDNKKIPNWFYKYLVE